MPIRRSEYLIGTEADWEARNPVLSKGQMAIVSPDNLMKFGDGATRFLDLPYSDTSSVDAGHFDGGHP